MTAYDDWPLLALEAELIFATASRGISWESALDMELWQIAAALGLHRVETRSQKDAREIVAVKQAEWEQTKDTRLERMADYSERRAARKRERVDERRNQGSRKP